MILGRQVQEMMKKQLLVVLHQTRMNSILKNMMKKVKQKIKPTGNKNNIFIYIYR